MKNTLSKFFEDHRVHEVECVIPDMTGIARGKILPRDLFLSAGEIRLPKSVLLNTVNGQQPDNGPFVGDTDPDMLCIPDASTIRMVPWAAEPVAVVIHDCQEWDGQPVALSPRAVLRRVLGLYEGQGLQPIVAPEMEFYLVARHTNPHEPLQPPIGRTGKPEVGRQSYSIDAVNDFDPFFMELSSFCDQHQLGVETLIHEAGPGQMEINFSHGDALDLADRVFLFKRTVRETALRHGVFATFMAKPMEQEPGSAMHIHQSLVSLEDGRNVFSNAGDDSASELFHHFIGGLQAYIPRLMPMFAPYVNSYRRLAPFMSAPVNVRWGYDNRTCGLRVPKSGPQARRIENRVPGVDVNPYLAMAATLACGWLGMRDRLQPGEPTVDSAWSVGRDLPRHLEDAIASMRSCDPMREVLGESFVDAFCAVKELEYGTYNRVISSWEREHLLLLV
ncbi:MAG: glutamine synthetase family protein [Rhodoferax sp.]|uniref:glutamine synthetase family protein n=1 Tax=Rhodoferax sp. TaxID=50421 RepID=UPI003265F1DB